MSGSMLVLTGPFGRRALNIAGGRAAVRNVGEILKKLATIDGEHGTTSQVFDASRIAGKMHLAHAAKLALTAQFTRRRFTSSLGLELVCWAAGVRQINLALERVGLRGGSTEVAILTLGRSQPAVKRAQADIFSELGIERDDSVLELTPKKTLSLASVFSISGRELGVAGIEKLVLEKIALLSLER